MATSLLLIDDNGSLREALARGLAAKGVAVHTAATFSEAEVITRVRPPSFVVSEIRLGSHSLFDYLRNLGSKLPADRVAVVTAYPSIATAVRFTRMGVTAYLPKPVNACQLLSELAGPSEPRRGGEEDSVRWASLDRTIWEYIHHVHCSAGSISEAARRLGLDRRSLRRMLSKHPPSR